MRYDIRNMTIWREDPERAGKQNNESEFRSINRAMKLIRKSEKMLFYLGSTNVDECLNQFRKDLCR